MIHKQTRTIEHLDTVCTDGRQAIALRRTAAWHKCLIVCARGAIVVTFRNADQQDVSNGWMYLESSAQCSPQCVQSRRRLKRILNSLPHFLQAL